MSGTVEAPGRERHVSKRRVLIGGNLGFTRDNKHALIREVMSISGPDSTQDKTGLTGGFRPVLRAGEDGLEIDRLDKPVGMIDFLRTQPQLVVESYAARTKALGMRAINPRPLLLNLDEARQVRKEQQTAWLELAFLEGKQDFIDRILKDDHSLDANWPNRVPTHLA